MVEDNLDTGLLLPYLVIDLEKNDKNPFPNLLLK